MIRDSIIRKIREKGIHSFLYRALVFVITLFILDYSIGSILNYFYFKQESGLLYRTTYSMDSTHADFLILGSSTANHHYIPNIFKNKLGMSVYNTGRDGNTIFYNYAIFQSILTRYHPRGVILDFNVTEFKFREESYDRISSLLPYYSNHPEIRQIIHLKSPFEKLKLKSKIYPYNSLLFTIAVGTLDFNKERKLIKDDNGYVPLYHVWDRKLSEVDSEPEYAMDTNKIRLFKRLIQECKNFNIPVFIVVSPRFLKYSCEDQSVAKAREIANNYNVPFFNYSKDTLFWNHPEFFANIPHLNNSGAGVFSNLVANNIINSQQRASQEKKFKLSINAETTLPTETITSSYSKK